jgi:hypothetical protein
MTRDPKIDSLGLKTTAPDTYKVLYQLSQEVLGMSSPLFSNYVLSSIFGLWLFLVPVVPNQTVIEVPTGS